MGGGGEYSILKLVSGGEFVRKGTRDFEDSIVQKLKMKCLALFTSGVEGCI